MPPSPVEVVNGPGAGDVVLRALCHRLSARWNLVQIMRFTNTAGATVVSRLACSAAMPTSDEVHGALEEAAHA